MSKPLRRNIGNSRSLKQLRGFNVGIRHANHVTLHGFRSLGRACILLKTFVGIVSILFLGIAGSLALRKIFIYSNNIVHGMYTSLL